MNIKDAKDILSKEYFSDKLVYGIGIVLCKGCGKEHIEFLVDNKFDKNKIPKKFHGHRVNVVFGEMPKALNPDNLQEAINKFSNEFILKKNIDGIYGVSANGKENAIKVYVEPSKSYLIPDIYEGFNVIKIGAVSKSNNISTIKITPTGTKEWMSAPITGGYIPETIAVLLLVRDGKPHNILDLKKSNLKTRNLDGVIQYLHSKRYLVTPEDAEFFYNPNSESNAIGVEDVGQYKVNLGKTLGEKMSINKAPAMYISQPRTIRITQKGFDFLNNNKGINSDNQYYLSCVILNALKDTKPHNEVEVMGKAGIGINDFNYTINMLRVSAMIYLN